MKLVIGGTISIVFGIVGITVFFSNFADIIQGLVPLILIGGGVLIIMLKREEAGFGEKKEDTSDTPEKEVSQPVSSEPVIAEPVAEAPVETKPPADETTEPAQPTSAFVGNESSLVFHSSGCKFSTSKKCTVSFATREAAIEKGFKPCTICKP